MSRRGMWLLVNGGVVLLGYLVFARDFVWGGYVLSGLVWMLALVEVLSALSPNGPAHVQLQGSPVPLSWEYTFDAIAIGTLAYYGRDVTMLGWFIMVLAQTAQRFARPPVKALDPSELYTQDDVIEWALSHPQRRLRWEEPREGLQDGRLVTVDVSVTTTVLGAIQMQRQAVRKARPDMLHSLTPLQLLQDFLINHMARPVLEPEDYHQTNPPT